MTPLDEMKLEFVRKLARYTMLCDRYARLNEKPRDFKQARKELIDLHAAVIHDALAHREKTP